MFALFQQKYEISTKILFRLKQMIVIDKILIHVRLNVMKSS